MVSAYKGLFAIYISVSFASIIAAAIVSTYYPESAFSSFVFAILIICITMIILSRIARRKFADEVLVHFKNCQIHEFMEKLEHRMGRKHGVMRSAYNYLAAMGHSALGNTEDVYACAQKITARSHRTEYLRRMIDYYVTLEQFEAAKPYIAEISQLAAKQKEQYKQVLEDYLINVDIHIRMSKGDVSGAEEFYTDYLINRGELPLISRVSFSYSLGLVLMMKGENERAKEYFEIAAKNGGDTKYQLRAAEKLAELG